MESQIATASEPVISGFAAGKTDAWRWNPGTRIAFRFAFAYFTIYNLVALLGTLPYTDTPLGWYIELWHKIVPWTAAHLLHLSKPITVFTNGSGDTTYDYVTVMCYLCLALAATPVWSWFDRRSASYPRLNQWFRLTLRLVLGASLITYGAAKVIQSQFPDPSLARMLQPYGDSSPMGLLWTMMGASSAYNVFTGAVEMAGGILLFIPGLTTLGALVAMLSMGNVFALNMTYDVPVKLYSFHLLSMAVLLALPDLRRLTDFLVLHRASWIPADPPLFARKWLNYGTMAAILLLGSYTAYASLRGGYDGRKAWNDSAKAPLYGIWMADEFSLDGEIRPLTLTDNTRWYRVIFDPFSEVSLQTVNGARRRFRGRINAAKKTITLAKREDPSATSEFTFEQATPQTLTLTGQMEGKKITARLHRVDPPTFPLNTRGFHWINEYPYNH